MRVCRTPEKVTAAVVTPRLLWGEKMRLGKDRGGGEEEGPQQVTEGQGCSVAAKAS